MPPAPPGASSEAGAIMVVDPRPRAHMHRGQNQTTEISVNPGRLRARGHPGRGGGVRTCLAFSANF
jgi:hypothetical protein